MNSGFVHSQVTDIDIQIGRALGNLLLREQLYAGHVLVVEQHPRALETWINAFADELELFNHDSACSSLRFSLGNPVACVCPAGTNGRIINPFACACKRI
jgi:hypothetical protein